MERGQFSKWPIHWKPNGQIINLCCSFNSLIYDWFLFFFHSSNKTCFPAIQSSWGLQLETDAQRGKIRSEGWEKGTWEERQENTRRWRQRDLEKIGLCQISSRHNKQVFEETPYSHLTLFCSSLLLCHSLQPADVLCFPIGTWSFSTSTFFSS